MARFANIYQPQTEIGQGLNNAIMSLFSGASPNERADREALAELRRSQIGTEGEQQRKLRGEADAIEGQNRAISNILPNMVRPITGDVNLEDALGYLTTRRAPMVESAGPPTREGQFPEQTAPWFDDTTRRKLDAVSQVAPLIQAGRGNAQQLAEALFATRNMEEQAGVLEGKIDPTRFFQSRGKPVSDIKDNHLFNPAIADQSPVALPGAARNNPAWKETIVNGKRQWINLNESSPSPSGISAPEPSALVQQFGGPIEAVDKATGKTVLLQPSRSGGKPALIEGYEPGVSASERNAAAKVEAGQKAAQAVIGQIDDIILHVVENPSSVGAVGIAKRAYEGISGQAGKPVGTQASDFRVKQRLLLGTMWRDLVGSGQISAGDYKIIEDILTGLGPLDSPETVTSAYRQVRDMLSAKLPAAASAPAIAPQGAPVQGGGWTPEKERRLQELRNRAQ